MLWVLWSPLLEAGGCICPGWQPGTARHPKQRAGGPSAQRFSVATPEVWQGRRGCRKPGGRGLRALPEPLDVLLRHPNEEHNGVDPGLDQVPGTADPGLQQTVFVLQAQWPVVSSSSSHSG